MTAFTVAVILMLAGAVGLALEVGHAFRHWHDGATRLRVVRVLYAILVDLAGFLLYVSLGRTTP
jgi:hypothetical protein